jgi:ferrous iron transport protein A
MTLNQLLENEKGIIKAINEKKLTLQMLSMGFVLGGEVKIERIAPLKDPIIISSGTNSISIRKEDALKVEINPTK